MTYMCISFVVPVTKLFVDSAHFKCLEQHDPHDSCSVPFPSETISRRDFEATAGQILQIFKHFSDYKEFFDLTCDLQIFSDIFQVSFSNFKLMGMQRQTSATI